MGLLRVIATMRTTMARQRYFQFLLTFAILLVTATSQSDLLAEEIAAGTAARGAVLGSAYDSISQSFIGQGCITGDPEPVGLAVGKASFENSLEERTASDQLGFTAGGRARFGAVKTSAAASFFRSMKSNSYSVSAIWTSEYNLEKIKIRNPKLTDIGKTVQGNSDLWRRTCGDQYVDEIVRGARLFFSVKVDFSSRERKEQFEARFQISGAAYSATATLQKASEEFSRDAKVTVSVLQLGGDVSKFTNVFPNNSEGRSVFVSCTLGDFSKCAEFIQNALNYATNATTGIGSQLKDSRFPNHISYITADYSAVGINFNDTKGLLETARQVRAKLSQHLEKSLQIASTIETLLSVQTSPILRAAIIRQKEANDENMVRIAVAADRCFDYQGECGDILKSFVLREIDEAALELPPAPKASIRIMTTSDGVLSRGATTNIFGKDSLPFKTFVQKTCVEVNKRLSIFGDDCEVEGYASEDTFISYGWPSGVGVSVVLYVEGVGLRKADIRFEGTSLQQIDLEMSSRKDDGRKGRDFAVLVIRTNRSQPGWLDINFGYLRHKLAGMIKHGDGRYYVRVDDAFGRIFDFDLAREKFFSEEKLFEAPRYVHRIVHFQHMHRWWDPDSPGTLISGNRPWSMIGSGKQLWRADREFGKLDLLP